jgi:hypothetical protein
MLLDGASFLIRSLPRWTELKLVLVLLLITLLCFSILEAFPVDTDELGVHERKHPTKLSRIVSTILNKVIDRYFNLALF